MNYNRTGKEKILRPGLANTGYLQVQLFKEGKGKMMLVHRLVANAFIPNPNSFETVNHRDEVKTNNAVSNLEWMTQVDNNIYSNALQVKMFDKSSGELLATFPSAMEAGRVMGIAHQSICICCNGKLKSSGGYVWKYA